MINEFQVVLVGYEPRSCSLIKVKRNGFSLDTIKLLTDLVNATSFMTL